KERRLACWRRRRRGLKGSAFARLRRSGRPRNHRSDPILVLEGTTISRSYVLKANGATRARSWSILADRGSRIDPLDLRPTPDAQQLGDAAKETPAALR